MAEKSHLPARDEASGRGDLRYKKGNAMRALGAVTGALALAVACAATGCTSNLGVGATGSPQTKASAGGGGTSATATAETKPAANGSSAGATTAPGTPTQTKTATPASGSGSQTTAKPVTHQATGTVVSAGSTQIVVARQFGRNKVNWTFVVNAKTNMEGKPAKAMRVRVYYHDDKSQHVAERVRIVAAAPMTAAARAGSAPTAPAKSASKTP